MLDIYNNLSTRDDTIATVQAYRTAKSPTQGEAVQHQYLVTWEPTLAQKWEIDLLTTHGMPYIIQSMALITDHHLAEHHTCEYCEEVTNSEGEALHLCTKCHRAYHTHCTPQQGEQKYESQEHTPNWECPDCIRYTAAKTTRGNTASPRYTDDTQTYLVQYEPSWEPEELVNQHPHLASKALELKTQCQQPKPPKRRLDADQCDRIRQGKCPNDRRRYETTIGSPSRKKLAVYPRPIHPHKDIHPTGDYTIQLGDHEEPNVAIIYSPDGQYSNQIPKESLISLWARYQGAKDTTEHARPTSFPEDVAALVTRYQTGSFSKEGPEIQIEGQQTLQPQIYQSVLNMFPNIKDRLASPLSVHPTVNHYWTAHKQDTLFGAQYDAYSVKWTGCSIAHPAHTPEATSKAISWAIRSAQATAQPTLTIVLAYHPTLQATSKNTPEPYYQRWVDTYPHYCKIQATLDALNTQYAEPNIWDMAHPNTPKRKAKCTLLVIANEAGFATYPQWDRIQECFTTSPDKESGTNSSRTLEATHTPQEPSTTMYRTHKKLRNLPFDLVPNHTIPTPAEAQAEVERLYSYRYPPKWDWKQFAYTDGSVISGTKTGPGIGAAVYIPMGAIPDQREDVTIPINPSTTNENTINRAELAAIWVALQKGAEHIATDSQCSINQIQKMLNRPHDMREHRHQNLLNHIVELIKQRATTTTLYKVKAHAGITGNEKADAMAKQVAKGANLDDIIHDVPESNIRTEKHWVTHKAAPTQTNPNPQAKTLPSLDQHLRNAIHQQHKLGMADQSTCYYAHWQNTLPHMMAAESNAFMTRQEVNAKERRTALQYRSGQLYNNKLGMRWGHVTTDNCPLCGGPDGGHHIASGCKKLQNMYTERHHKAGRIILKAILKGERAAEVAYADVGSASNLSKDTVPDIDNRHNLRLPQKSTRPDIILASTTQKQLGRISSITLVEIKYCRDSDITPQLDRANSQHQALSAQLQHLHQCSTQTLPILLGVSGAVYNIYTAGALQQLGIRGNLLKTTLRRLHTQAIQSLGSIVSTRRRYERKHQPATGQRRRQQGGTGPGRGPRTARHRDTG